MRFSETRQRHAVCVAIARWLQETGHHPSLVDESGPVFDFDGTPPSLSSGQRVLARLILDVWNGSGMVRIIELGVLDADFEGRVATLLLALARGGKHLDGWLRVEGARELHNAG